MIVSDAQRRNLLGRARAGQQAAIERDNLKIELAARGNLLDDCQRKLAELESAARPCLAKIDLLTAQNAELFDAVVKAKREIEQLRKLNKELSKASGDGGKHGGNIRRPDPARQHETGRRGDGDGVGGGDGNDAGGQPAGGEL